MSEEDSSEQDLVAQSGAHLGKEWTDHGLLWDSTEHEYSDLDDEERSDAEISEPEGYIVPVKALHSGEAGELAIYPGQLYAGLEADLDSRFTDRTDLTLLEQVDGPKPYWRFPAPQAKVSMYCQKLYAVDRKASFILATVRTPESDAPILIPVDQQDFGTLTIENLIKPALEAEGLTAKKVTAINFLIGQETKQGHAPAKRKGADSTPLTVTTGDNDIKTETFTHYYIQARYSPTVFFVETDFNPDALQFRTVVPESIIPRMQTILINAETLVMKTVHAQFCSLQAIYLARSILHLVVSMIDDAAHSSPTRWLWQVKDLESALALVQEYIGALSPEKLFEPSFQETLDTLFHTLCYERSGAVAIRNSYSAFCQLSELDRAALASISVANDPKGKKVPHAETFRDSQLTQMILSPDFKITRVGNNLPSQAFLAKSHAKPNLHLPEPVEHPQPTQILWLPSALEPPMDHYRALSNPARIVTFDDDDEDEDDDDDDDEALTDGGDALIKLPKDGNFNARVPAALAPAKLAKPSEY